jgi:hypothetical protein
VKIYNIIPVAIMVQNFMAAIGCAYFGKYGSATYWMAAGLLNFAVIFLIPGE